MTPRQRDAFEFIAARQTKAGPTLRELAKHLGVSGNAAQRHVEALRKSGHVAPNDGNGIVVVGPDERRLHRPTRAPEVEPTQTALPPRRMVLKPSGAI